LPDARIVIINMTSTNRARGHAGQAQLSTLTRRLSLSTGPEGERSMPLDDAPLHLIHSADSASALMRGLGERPSQLGAIALDTECTGLSPERDRVRLVQISDDRTGWAIPFDDWGGVVKEVVSKWTKRYRMHNATYDCSMLDAMGIHIPR